MYTSEFNQLFDTYYPAIYRYVYFRVGHREDAEDVVAATFEKAMRAFQKQPMSLESAKPWLYRIATNAVTDHCRRGKLRSTQELEEATVVIDNQLEVKVDQNLQLEKIQILLKQLPNRQQELMLLRYEAELSNKEIAELIGITEKSVSSQLSKAIQTIQHLL